MWKVQCNCRKKSSPPYRILGESYQHDIAAVGKGSEHTGAPDFASLARIASLGELSNRHFRHLEVGTE